MAAAGETSDTRQIPLRYFTAIQLDEPRFQFAESGYPESATKIQSAALSADADAASLEIIIRRVMRRVVEKWPAWEKKHMPALTAGESQVFCVTGTNVTHSGTGIFTVSVHPPDRARGLITSRLNLDPEATKIALERARPLLRSQPGGEGDFVSKSGEGHLLLLVRVQWRNPKIPDSATVVIAEGELTTARS